ncbi:LapA family protein [Oceanospirillum sp.]|uniref:LapA family protein n=1 Tax=Oceanospirillum sp. TaxID=2021254 RepID=UPI003A926E5D
MRWLKSGILFVVVLTLLITGVLFSSRNTTPYAIDLLIFRLPEISISLLILGSLVIGLITGWLLSLTTFVRLKASQLRSEKALKTAQKELDTLRISGLKDSQNE